MSWPVDLYVTCLVDCQQVWFRYYITFRLNWDIISKLNSHHTFWKCTFVARLAILICGCVIFSSHVYKYKNIYRIFLTHIVKSEMAIVLFAICIVINIFTSF